MRILFPCLVATASASMIAAPLSVAAGPADFSWTGANGLSWGDADNWLQGDSPPNDPPGCFGNTGGDVVIEGAGPIMLDCSTAGIAQLDALMSQTSIRLFNSLQVESPSFIHGLILTDVFPNPKVIANGRITLFGDSEWNRGVFQGAGGFTLFDTMTIATSQATLATDMTVSGDLIFDDFSSMTLSPVESGGLVTMTVDIIGQIRGDGLIQSTGPFADTLVSIDGGTVRSDTTGGLQINTRLASSGGIFDAQSGDLFLVSGGHFTGGEVMRASSGNTLEMRGSSVSPSRVDGVMSIAGNGTVALSTFTEVGPNGTILNDMTPASRGSDLGLAIDGGSPVVSLFGDGARLINRAHMVWNNGTVTGTGALRNDNRALFVVGSETPEPLTVTLSGLIQNRGVMEVRGRDLFLNSGGITNEADGVLRVFDQDIEGAGLITNAGRIETTNTDPADGVLIQPTMRLIDDGMLVTGGSPLITSLMLTEGNPTVDAADGSIRLGGDIVMLSGDLTIRGDSHTVSIANGSTIDIDANSTLECDVNSALLLPVPSGSATIDGAGLFRNTGNIDWSGGGVIALRGDDDTTSGLLNTNGGFIRTMANNVTIDGGLLRTTDSATMRIAHRIRILNNARLEIEGNVDLVGGSLSSEDGNGLVQVTGRIEQPDEEGFTTSTITAPLLVDGGELLVRRGTMSIFGGAPVTMDDALLSVVEGAKINLQSDVTALDTIRTAGAGTLDFERDLIVGEDATTGLRNEIMAPGRLIYGGGGTILIDKRVLPIAPIILNAAGGTMEVIGGQLTTEDSRFRNDGQLDIRGSFLSPGIIDIQSGAAVDQTSSVIDLADDGLISITEAAEWTMNATNGNVIISGTAGGTTVGVVNDGHIIKRGTQTATIESGVDSQGIVEVIEGTLRLTGDSDNVTPDGTMIGGTWIVRPGASLRVTNVDDDISQIGIGTTIRLESDVFSAFPSIRFAEANEGDLELQGSMLDLQSNLGRILTTRLSFDQHFRNEFNAHASLAGVIEGVPFQKQFGPTNSTLSADNFTNAGILRPTPRGDKGAMTINGNFIQEPTGILAVDIDGLPADGHFDRLHVTGDAQLGGRIAVQLPGGDEPGVGDMFAVMTVDGTITGSIESVSGPGIWSASVIGQTVFVTLMSAPTCDSDVSGNGVVGFEELVQVLNDWDFCPECETDFNGDGFVTISDLVQLLNDWGPCDA